MKQLLKLLLTFMLSTTFVFANTIPAENEAIRVIDIMTNLNIENLEHSENNCKQNKKIIRHLNKKIKRALKRNESMEQSLLRVERGYEKNAKRVKRKVSALLKGKRLQRKIRRLKRKNPLVLAKRC